MMAIQLIKARMSVIILAPHPSLSISEEQVSDIPGKVSYTNRYIPPLVKPFRFGSPHLR